MEGAQPVDGIGRLDEAVEGEVHLVPIGHGDQQEADRRCTIALQQQIAQRVKIPLATSTSSCLRPAGSARASSAAQRSCRWRDLATARSRSRGAETSGLRRPRAGRSCRRDTSSPWPSTRYASPAAPRPAACPTACSPGFTAFHRAKSRAASFSYSSTSTRAPSSMPSKSFFESLPYSGNPSRCGSTSCHPRPGRRCPWPPAARSASPSREYAQSRAADAPAARCPARPDPQRRPARTAPYTPSIGLARGSALRMILSSTSVTFMTWSTAMPCWRRNAAQHVDVEEGAEVADVAVVVHSRAAAVHSQCWAADGLECLDLAAKGIEEFDSCHVLSVPAAAGAWRGADCSRLEFLVDFS